MKRLICSIVFLLVCSIVFADTIYLKSGRKIEGDISEKTDEFIKVDVEGVTVTYYTEEIEQIIESAPEKAEKVVEDAPDEIEQAAQEAPGEVGQVVEEVPDEPENVIREVPESIEQFIEKASGETGKVIIAEPVPPLEIESVEMPAEPSHPESSPQPLVSPSTTYLSYLDAVQGGDWEQIKRYLSEIQLPPPELMAETGEMLQAMKAMAPKEVNIEEEKIEETMATLKVTGTLMTGESKGEILLINDGGEWKVENENWNIDLPTEFPDELEAPLPPEEIADIPEGEKGFGTISGTIILPDDEDRKGDLYISFIPMGHIVIGPDTPNVFTVIKGETIFLKNVLYKIENVPTGNYMGSATWDLAEPFWESSWGEGNCPMYPGDRGGAYLGEVLVKAGEEAEGIDIKCETTLEPPVGEPMLEEIEEPMDALPQPDVVSE